MPLFTSGNDARLISSISREIIHKYISIEIEMYKLSLENTRINLYNESPQKTYYQPIRLFALLNKDATSAISDVSLDFTQTVQFKFLRDDLIDINFMIEEGDIIKFDERYYEVDNAQTTQYWGGKNQDTHLMSIEGRDRQFGYNVAIVAQTHLTRVSNLNIIDIRSGIE